MKLYRFAPPLYISSSEDGQSWLWAGAEGASVGVAAVAEGDETCAGNVSLGTHVQMDCAGLKSHKPQKAPAAANTGHTVLGRHFS